MFHIRRQSIDLTGRIRCGGRFRDSLLGRVFSTTTGARSIRRRRPTTSRLGTKTSSTSDDDEVNTKFVTQVNNMMESVSGFVATDKDGREMTMDEYLKFATLSPWVPCPDPVARRCFDIAKAGPNDIHYELGSGDGRLNFHAIDVYNVKKSVGIDIDPSLIKKSRERIAKRHPAPTNIEFICTDLIEDSAESKKLWDKIKSECTIMTMFFVEDALQKIKPKIERHMVGSDCKIVTIGYEMKGWEPIWAEVILGLTVHLYDLSNLDQLYNTSEAFSVSNLDEDLNSASRQKLAEIEELENGENPFGNVSVPLTLADKDDHDTDYHWDFDENEVFDDDDFTNSETKKR